MQAEFYHVISLSVVFKNDLAAEYSTCCEINHIISTDLTRMTCRFSDEAQKYIDGSIYWVVLGVYHMFTVGFPPIWIFMT